MKHGVKRIRISTGALVCMGVLCFLGGCNRLKLYNFDRGAVVASVGAERLYEADLAGLVEPGLDPADSLALVQSAIDTWVRREIKTQAAAGALTESQESQVRDMVEQYRGWLLGHVYEQQWLDARLDTLVTQQQTTEYYNTHRDDFRLTGPVVRSRVVRIPAGLRQSQKLEEMFRSTAAADRADFLNICQKNNYRYDDFSSGGWVDFGTVVRLLPFQQTNFDEFLRRNRYYENEDGEYKYMLVIDAFRSTGDYAPVEMEAANIRRILINGRRHALLTTLEDSLYQAAQGQHRIQINVKQPE